MSQPPYTQSKALEAAMNRIITPPKDHNYEHFVGTWAATNISHHFCGDIWAITPEVILPDKKRPDIIVEKAVTDQNDTRLDIHAVFELKKKEVRIEEGLAQLAETIPLAIYELGWKSGDEFETFAVVMAGTDIAFFEYHNDVTNLDEEGIEQETKGPC